MPGIRRLWVAPVAGAPKRMGMNRILGCWTLLLCIGLVASNCRSESADGVLAPADTVAPALRVVFPAAGQLDRDEDGLLDVEIAVADSGLGLDPETYRVTSDRPVHGPAETGANLLEHWPVERADSLGLVFEETLVNLLPRGRVRLTISASDKAGNRASERLEIWLPPAALHKVIDLQVQGKLGGSGLIALAPDGRKAYVTTEEHGGSPISIVDLESLTLVKNVRTPISALWTMAVDSARGRLYVSSLNEPWLAVFDLASETFLPPIATSARGIGVAYDRHRDLVYIGLEVEAFQSLSSGFISVVDVAQGVETRVIELGITDANNPGDRLGLNAMLLDPSDERLYAASSSGHQGVLVIDPVAGEIIDQVDLWPEPPIPPTGEIPGNARDLRLDRGQLIATSNSQNGMGRMAVVPLSDLTNVRFGNTGQFVLPKHLAATPDGQEWAISTGDRGVGYSGVLLMDAATMRVIWDDRFPEGIFEGVAFRPDGKVFVVAGTRTDLFPPPSPGELLVYLRR